MKDDLEEDWATLRPIPIPIQGVGMQTPSIVPGPDQDADLEGSWAALRNLPEFVYVCRDKDTSFNIWRLRVHGERKVQAHGGVTTDCWVVSYNKLILNSGSPPAITDYHHRHTVEKTGVALDLKNAHAWIRAFQIRQVRDLTHQIENWKHDIEERHAWIERAQAKLVDIATLTKEGNASSLQGILPELEPVIQPEESDPTPEEDGDYAALNPVADLI